MGKRLELSGKIGKVLLLLNSLLTFLFIQHTFRVIYNLYKCLEHEYSEGEQDKCDCVNITDQNHKLPLLV